MQEAAAALTTNVPQILGPNLGFVNPAVIGFSVFWLVFFLVLIYTGIAIYHWTRYGHRSPIAIPAVCLHIFVSLALVGFAATGL